MNSIQEGECKLCVSHWEELKWGEERASFPGCCIRDYVRGINPRMGSACVRCGPYKSTLLYGVGGCH